MVASITFIYTSEIMSYCKSNYILIKKKVKKENVITLNTENVKVKAN